VQAQARIEAPVPKRVDIGRIEYQKGAERRVSAFANVLSFGLGGLTDQIVDASPKWLGGRTTFFLGAIRATLAHQPVPVELSLDGRIVETAAYSNVAVCLGRYFGSGMQIAPQADVADGYFDVITMEMPRLQTLTLAGDIYRGAHLRRKGVTHYRAREVVARATRASECLIDVDGEQLGSLPLSIALLPRALEVLT
jgi:diacylglycerol kinase family enzyme